MPPAGPRPGARRLFQIDPRPFRGVAYRVIGSRFLTSPLASAGSRLRGGRFNPPGEFEVLYVALGFATAFAERDAVLLTAAGVRATRAVRTGVLLRLECRLAAVLDATDQRVRARLGVNLSDLLGPWLPWNTAARGRAPGVAPSQVLGRTIHASRRFEAILYPSTKDPTGRCLAIFPDRLRPGSSVAVNDPDGILRATLGLGGASVPPRRVRARRQGER
jgi:RES domain-containing protein